MLRNYPQAQALREAGRLLAAAMARAHLANSHDVIMPQMMTSVNAGELADFGSAVAAAEAEYCRILDCERLTVEQTCQAVEAALRPSRSASSPR